MASLENRRRYPVRRLSITDFAGVHGEVHIDFGALTISYGTSRLSRSITELLRLFGDRRIFENVRQPRSGKSRVIRRLPFDDEQDLLITVTSKEPRVFTDQAKLSLQLSEGRCFICVISQNAPRLYLGDAHLPTFTPVIRIVSVIDPMRQALAHRDESLNAEENLAAYFGITRAELAACIAGLPSDHPALFEFGYRIDEQGRCLVKTSRHPNATHLEISALSSGEQCGVLLDIGVRVATHAAKVSPVVLLVDNRAISSLDPAGVAWFLEWVESARPPFQVVVDLWEQPSRGDLHRALCYSVRGTDMAVKGFDLLTWSRFRRT